MTIAEDVIEQAEQCMRNIVKALEDAESGLENFRDNHRG
jgi:enamine deaminase RidA (YjgF/YER057c/UK114 family)